ncbi:YihY/virulence factor BrkB family protein [Aestuariivirga sp.]|uniref:YihY/virulence factor BrkB family protein n=1 Tax=Aestuariivirga sp. TaxID=2650926 RepID=UPI0039E4F539
MAALPPRLGLARDTVYGWPDMKESRANIIRLGLEAIQRLFADEAIPLAGNIAFRTVFSIFPFLIFLTALAGFLGSDELAQGVVNYLLSVAPEQLVHPFAPEIRSILTVPRTGLLSVSALITIWSATSGVDSVRVGLNRAYNLKDTRPFWWLYLQNILFVIAAAAVLLIFATLIVFAPVLINFIDDHSPDLGSRLAAFDVWRYPIAIVLLTVALTVCHRVLPASPPRMLELLPGVLVTVVVWMILSEVFSYYLQRFNTFALTYASLSGVFAVMFFIYLSALVLILGGELNRVLIVHRARHDVQADEAPGPKGT